ncbi:MAG TPA: DUF5671 domain-containing protein [Candidatus Baltobacteraceae bacterium]|nr:DUF5671 domain-containing protein [Candidatus Baltobacteraceae bacterium]
MAARDPADLTAFVRSAKAQGIADAELVALLAQHGWSERRVYSALSHYYAERVGPIPERGGRAENARDAFLYLLAFSTLAIWTVALVWLAQILVNRAFPNPSYDEYTALSFRQAAAGQLAALIVAYPIFLAVSRFIVLQTRRKPESLESGVRKWLTYVALVITTVILVADGVWSLKAFFLGDLTLQFTIKAAAVFAVAACVLWYYLGSMRSDSRPGGKRDAIFAYGSAAVVLAAIVAGFSGLGAPQYNRDVAYDDRRLDDFRQIAAAVNTQYERTKKLPERLDGLRLSLNGSVRDPRTDRPYAYVRGRGDSYRLCATFDTDDRSQAHSVWNHPAGAYCFALSASDFTP